MSNSTRFESLPVPFFKGPIAYYPAGLVHSNNAAKKYYLGWFLTNHFHQWTDAEERNNYLNFPKSCQKISYWRFSILEPE